MASNWTQLRQAARARFDEDLRTLELTARLAEKVLERETPTLAHVFISSAEVLCRIFLTSGRDRARATTPPNGSHPAELPVASPRISQPPTPPGERRSR